MHVEPHHAAEELESLTRQQIRAAARRRFRAVTLATAGHTAEAIAAALGCTTRGAQKWVARYNRGGAGAPAGRPTGPRP